MTTDTEILNKRKLDIKKAGAMLKKVKTNSTLIDQLTGLHPDSNCQITLCDDKWKIHFLVSPVTSSNDLKKILVERRGLLWVKVRNNIADYLREENELLNKQIKIIVNNG